MVQRVYIVLLILISCGSMFIFSAESVDISRLTGDFNQIFEPIADNVIPYSFSIHTSKRIELTPRQELIRDTVTWFALSAIPFGASSALYTTLIGLTLAPYAPYLAYYTISFSSLEIASFVLGSIFGTITLGVGAGFVIMGILSARKLYKQGAVTTLKYNDTLPTVAVGFTL
jgi:hypothetical protein